MASKPKLSLVAQFDELTRYRSVLTAGIESEFISFVVNQEECRKRWLDVEQSFHSAETKNKILEQEKQALETKLKHARKQIDNEMEKRKYIESQFEGAEKQILLVRELLNDKNSTTILNEKDREKLVFLSNTLYDKSPRRHANILEESNSVLSPSDISYDKTEDLDDFVPRNRGGKRPSAPPLENENDDVFNQNIDFNKQAKRHRRSKSADLVKAEANGHHGNNANDKLSHQYDDDIEKRQRRKSSPYVTPNEIASPWSTEMKRINSGSSLTRPHFFVQKNIYNMTELCFVCNKKLRFGKEAAKCKDCRIVCHMECKEIAPLPCSINGGTSPNLKKNIQGSICDYAPTEPPYIPILVIHCVNEVERRGFKEQGIYRVSGSEKEVKELKERFLKGKPLPNLNLINDIHVVCGCLKDFLRSLKEPLITFNLWKDFARAAEKIDVQERLTELYQAVSQLPLPNRDTLAFLIIHLQRVSEANECRMSVSNICRVFGPTIIGFTCSDPQAANILSETPKQALVMEALMSIGADYWKNFVDLENKNKQQSMMYGHVNTPSANNKIEVQTKITKTTYVTPSASEINQAEPQWFTNNYLNNNQAIKKPGNFFASPTLR